MCGYLVYEAEGIQKIRYADENLIYMLGCRDFAEFSKHVRGCFSKRVYKDDINRVQQELVDQANQPSDDIDCVNYCIVHLDGAIRKIEDIGHKQFIDNGVPVFYAYLADIIEE